MFTELVERALRGALPNPNIAAQFFEWAYKRGYGDLAELLWDWYSPAAHPASADAEPAEAEPHPFGVAEATRLRQVASAAGLRLYLRTHPVGREARVAFLRRVLLRDQNLLPTAELARELGLTPGDLVGQRDDSSLSPAEQKLVRLVGCCEDFSTLGEKRWAAPAPEWCLEIYAHHYSAGELCSVFEIANWVVRSGAHAELRDDQVIELFAYLARRRADAAAVLYHSRPDMQVPFGRLITAAKLACGYELTVMTLTQDEASNLDVYDLYDLGAPVEVVKRSTCGHYIILNLAVCHNRVDIIEQSSDWFEGVTAEEFQALFELAKSREMVDCLLRARPGAPVVATRPDASRFWYTGASRDVVAYKYIRCGAGSGDCTRDLIKTLFATDSPVLGEFIDTVLADTLHGPRAVAVLLRAMLAPSACAHTPLRIADGAVPPSPAAVARYLARVTYAPTPGECVAIAYMLALASPVVAHVVVAMLPGVRAALPPAWAPGADVDRRQLDVWPRGVMGCSRAALVRDAETECGPLAWGTQGLPP